MTSPKPPIIIAEGLDVGIYDSVAEAQTALEAVDVRDGIYVGFDASGRRLAFSTEPRRSRRVFGLIPIVFDAVVIQLAEEMPTGEDELRDLLTRAVQSLGHDHQNIVELGMEDLPLAELIQVAKQIFGPR